MSDQVSREVIDRAIEDLDRGYRASSSIELIRAFIAQQDARIAELQREVRFLENDLVTDGEAE